MPVEEVLELDTIVKGIKIYQLFTTVENSTFLVQKSLIENHSKDDNLSKLPHNIENLNKYYDGVVIGMTNNTSYDNVRENKITKNGFIGRKIVFSNSTKELKYESEVFVLNNYMYNFTYVNNIAFDQVEKDYFFKSMKINENKNVSQIKGKSTAYRRGYILGKLMFYVLLTVGTVILFIKLFKKK